MIDDTSRADLERAQTRRPIIGGKGDRPSDSANDERAGSSWFRELYDLYAPARREAIERGYTEAEINAWIDEAVQAVRRSRAGR